MDRKEEALKLLDANWTGRFTKPSPNLYPHQWNWDAGFIALGNAQHDLSRVITEYRSLFAGQWSNGLLPHIVFGPPTGHYFPEQDFWQSDRSTFSPKNVQTSGITQPPVHGFILKRIYDKHSEDSDFIAFLKEIFPKLVKLHEYYYRDRNPLRNGLITIRHPWESGTDNSPIWDEALSAMQIDKDALPDFKRKDLQNPKAAGHRPTHEDYDRYVYLVDLFRRLDYDEEKINEQCPFQIVDPLFNAILTWSNEAIITLGDILQMDYGELIYWNEQTIYSMNELLWDEQAGIYHAWDAVESKKIEVHTHSGLMPMIGGIPDVDQVEQMIRRMTGPNFKNDETYYLPSYNLSQSDIDHEKYWRGPIWISTNWLIIQGLNRYGFDELADEVFQDTIELIHQFGFYEYFDPRRNVRNNGYGTNQFSWSASLYLDMLN
ncbi:MAG: glycoside hydrolase [Bacteroidia bacterium]|nr:glycoside hydrolase [Bacteroidia bacterium]